MNVLKTYGADGEDYHTSLTYKIDGGHIRGKIDGLEAVKQAVDLILSTERFEYPIYSTDYGIETKALIGKGREYIRGDLQRRIAEALAQDDRVTGISGFDVTFSGETAIATFTVNTEFGDVQEEVETTYGR